MNKVAVITGGSSGIGRSTAQMLADTGYTVYELSRSGHNTDKVHHLTVDVTLDEQVSAAFRTVYEQTGRLDLLINNAGYGISGAIEFTSIDAAQNLFNVNFFGGLRCIQAALPYLRNSRGRIINVSSVAAPIAIPFQAFYSASKAAVSSLTMALANEVRPMGISVCAVLPGDVATGFTAARKKSDDGEELYGERINRAVSAMEHDERCGMPPEQIARRIVRAAQKKHVKPLIIAGKKYQLFYFLFKLLPARVSNWIVGKMYA